jgi:hypothetical protein
VTPRWVFVAVAAIAGCGGGLGTQPPDSPGASGSSEGSLGTGDPPAPITVTRSGGIAGVNDVVEIAPDGSARVARRNGEVVACTPSADAIARLRAIDLRAMGSRPPKHTIADAFSYTVTTGGSSVSVEEGDLGAGPVDLLAAASEIVSSCLANTSPDTY